MSPTIKSAIIVAGGSGTRMNSDIPKQFQMLAGKPVLMHSILAFHEADPDTMIIVALPASHFAAWEEYCTRFGFTLPHQVTAGGETRFHSVRNALACVPSQGWVAIHDGARPMVTASLIRTAFQAAEQNGNCIPVVPLAESARQILPGGSRVVDRRDYRIVQTPQVFRSTILKQAYEQPYRESFTDDAAVAEGVGEKIHLIQGDPENIKITHPHDLLFAEVLMKNR